MVLVKRLVLDVLKPHLPTALEFCSKLAEVGDDYAVSLSVLEVDQDTETVEVSIEGHDLDFEAIQAVITKMSCSLHSVDVVEVLASSSSIPQKSIHSSVFGVALSCSESARFFSTRLHT